MESLDGHHDFHSVPQRRLDEPSKSLGSVCRHFLREIAEDTREGLWISNRISDEDREG